jgi:uncharacterized repeat protein (TIGR03943 family)
VRIDAVRAVRAATVFAWAALFMWLWLSGEQVRFIGPKTAWVVPFGAIALTLGAICYAGTVFTRARGPRPTIGDLLGAIVFVIPILLVLTVPDPSLGSLAAQRKSAKNVRLAPPPKSGDLLDVYTIAYARQDPKFAREVGAVPGAHVSISGVLSDSDPETADFNLVRFKITCCVADARPYSVTVWPENAAIPDGAGDDQWLAVDGYLAQAPDGSLQVRATSIAEADTPSNPYS